MAMLEEGDRVHFWSRSLDPACGNDFRLLHNALQIGLCSLSDSGTFAPTSSFVSCRGQLKWYSAMRFIHFVKSFFVSVVFLSLHFFAAFSTNQYHGILKRHFIHRGKHHGNDLFYVSDDGYAMLHRRLPNGTVAVVPDGHTEIQNRDSFDCIHVRHTEENYEDVKDMPFLVPVIKNTVNKFFHYMIDTGAPWKPKYPLCNDYYRTPKHRWSLKTILLALVKENLRDAAFRKHVNISRLEYALKKVLSQYARVSSQKAPDVPGSPKPSYKHVYIDDHDDEIEKMKQLIIERLKVRELYHNKHNNTAYYKYFGKYLTKTVNDVSFSPNITQPTKSLDSKHFMSQIIAPVVMESLKSDERRSELESRTEGTLVDMNITKGTMRHDKRLIEQYRIEKLPKQHRMLRALRKRNKEKSDVIRNLVAVSSYN